MAPGAGNLERDRMLSTGKVAQLLSVTSDTVLKWIKHGRLPARKTAGGHYRIAHRDVERLMGDGSEPSPAVENGFVYCWEYYSTAGSPSESCLECLVYRARARRCYEMSGLAKETGYAGAYCGKSCAECSYYQEVVLRPRRVLIVTKSAELKNRLERESSDSRIDVDFASSEYECSTACHEFKPEFVVVDGSLPRPVRASLCSHLAADTRIPGVQIIMANADDGGSEADPSSPCVDCAIPRTFGLAELEKHIIGLEVKPAAFA